MTPSHAPQSTERLTIRAVGGLPEITIPARSSWISRMFLAVWLCVWSLAGVYVLTNLASLSTEAGGTWGTALWLVAWLIGELLVLGTLLWFAAGAQVLRIRGSDLEAADRILRYERKRTYRGAEIRDLRARDPDGYTGPRRPVATPINRDRRNSSIAFELGGRTVYLAMGLDKAEGQMIVDQLRRHLPAGAVARS